ncbi:HD-GYP domain-containing protein [Heliorestis acidaminivorans]|nr:HD-GYP domain-containing protein [Heliorestis acidaminivorans]
MQFPEKNKVLSNRYKAGDILDIDVYTLTGRLLIPKDTVLTETIFQQILKWEDTGVLAGKKRRDNKQPNSLNHTSKQAQNQLLFQQSIETVRDVFLDFREGHGFNEQKIRHTTNNLVTQIVQDEKVGLRLSRLWDSDDYTLHHSVDVCLLSTMIGLNLGLTESELQVLATGAILHDIGKIHIPLEVLNKKGKLDEEEYRLIKKHPEIGMSLFEEQNLSLSHEESCCILQHHEWCNGEGYPYKLKYAKIHLYARIIAVADVYSALTTNRSYRGRLDHIRATDILTNQARDHLDKHIVFVFLDRLRDLMLNTRVRLSNGVEGYVVQFYDNAPLQPTVLVTENEGGEKIVSPYLIHLKERTDLMIERVLYGNI